MAASLVAPYIQFSSKTSHCYIPIQLIFHRNAMVKNLLERLLKL